MTQGTEPLISLAAGVLPEFPPEVIADAAGRAGYPATGIWFDADRWSDATTRAIRERLGAHGLVALDIEPIWIREGREVTDAARRMIDAGGELGARHALIVSVNASLADTQRQFAVLCELAERAGMRAMLEFLMITAIKSLDDARKVVEGVGHPAGGVLVDALHLARSGGRPDDLQHVAPGLLSYAQLCDAPATIAEQTYEAYLADAIDARSAPGEGGLPLRELLAALPPGTPLSLEVRSKQYRDRFADPVERARAVLDATHRFLQAPI